MTLSISHDIQAKLKSKGADFVKFVDISGLSKKQNKGYCNAVLIGILLSPAYLLKVTNTPDFIEEMKRKNRMKEDEFNNIEIKTDGLADDLEDYLVSKGYSAYSQSEKNVASSGFYDETNKSTPLPHKTIAGLAGMGWIGRHNLLVTPEYGSAISMCSVLTNAPLEAVLRPVSSSRCGDCRICTDICKAKAIKGKAWELGMTRNEIVDVNLCTTCLKCLVLCPWTQRYMEKGINENTKIHNQQS